MPCPWNTGHRIGADPERHGPRSPLGVDRTRCLLSVHRCGFGGGNVRPRWDSRLLARAPRKQSQKVFEESLHVCEILVPLVADEAAPSGMLASGWPQPKCFVSDSRLAALPLRITSWRPAYLHLVSSSAVLGFVIQYTGIIFNRAHSNRPFHKPHPP
jgi:hypothetical protein